VCESRPDTRRTRPEGEERRRRSSSTDLITGPPEQNRVRHQNQRYATIAAQAQEGRGTAARGGAQTRKSRGTRRTETGEAAAGGVERERNLQVWRHSTKAEASRKRSWQRGHVKRAVSASRRTRTTPFSVSISPRRRQQPRPPPPSLGQSSSSGLGRGGITNTRGRAVACRAFDGRAKAKAAGAAAAAAELRRGTGLGGPRSTNKVYLIYLAVYK
jgi:hypothetical protein